MQHKANITLHMDSATVSASVGSQGCCSAIPGSETVSATGCCNLTTACRSHTDCRCTEARPLPAPPWLAGPAVVAVGLWGVPD